MKYNYDYGEIYEKIETMVKLYEGACISMTLIAYITGEDENVLRFFIGENINPYNKTTYLINWDSGYIQETFNLFSTNDIYVFFEREKIKLEREYMEEKYGEAVRKNLRGKWSVDGKIIDCYIPLDAITLNAMKNTVKFAEKEIAEYMSKYTTEING